MDNQNNSAYHIREINYLNRRVNELEMSLKVYQEATIRKRDILETSRDYLQSVIDNIGDLVLVIDTSYRVVLANNKLKKLINGIDPAEKGLLCHRVSHLSKMSCKDKDQPCPMKKILRSKSPVSFTRMHNGSDGQIKFFDIIAAPLFNHKGEIVHIIESSRDITDRVNSEQALLDSETRYRSLFEQSRDAIFIFQTDGPGKGKIVSANHSASSMHGYADKELLELSITDLMEREDIARIFQQESKGSSGGIPRLELMHRKKDGTFFPVEVSASFIKAGGKKLMLAIYRDISARKKSDDERTRLIDKLERMSRTDGLTGLFNRQYLDKRLSEEIHRSERYGHPLSLIMFDIDNFKYINDTYGHLAGDKILQTTSSIINEVIRDSDIAGRFGGDEFMVILTETDVHVGIQVAERINRKIRQHSVTLSKRRTARYTVSIGIAQYSTPCKTAEQFIAKADKALYAAKKKGGGNVSREFTE